MQHPTPFDNQDTQQIEQNAISQDINLAHVNRSTIVRALLVISIVFGFLVFGFGGYILGIQRSGQNSSVSVQDTSVVPTQTPAIMYESLPSNTSQVKDCISNDLKISVQIDQSWKCEVKTVEPGFGSMKMSNNLFTIELENLGRGYGCNLAPNCVHSDFYASSLVDLQLLTADGIDKYIFGTFKDNTDEVSYGGVEITYTGIGNYKLSDKEKESLFKILDSFKRIQ